MTTIKQLAKQIFSSLGLPSVTEVTDKLHSLDLSAVNNSLLAATRMYHQLDTQADAAELGEEFFEDLADAAYASVTEEVEAAKNEVVMDSYCKVLRICGVLSKADFEQERPVMDVLDVAWNFVRANGKQFSQSTGNITGYEMDFTIATLAGNPLMARLSVVQEPGRDESERWLRSEVSLVQYPHGDQTAAPTVVPVMAVAASNVHLNDTFLMYANDETGFQLTAGGDMESTFVATIDDISNELQYTASFNTLLADVLGLCSSSAMPSRDTLLSFISSSPLSTPAMQLADEIRALPNYSLTTVLGVITRTLSSSAKYDDGASFYTPAESSSMVTSVMSLVATVVVAVIGTILSIVFRGIGVILAAAWAILSKAISWASQNLSLTIPSVRSVTTPLPAWSLYPKTVENLPLGGLSEDELKVIREYGVATVIDPHDPFPVLVGQQSDASYFAQVWIPAWHWRYSAGYISTETLDKYTGEPTPPQGTEAYTITLRPSADWALEESDGDTAGADYIQDVTNGTWLMDISNRCGSLLAAWAYGSKMRTQNTPWSCITLFSDVNVVTNVQLLWEYYGADIQKIPDLQDRAYILLSLIERTPRWHLNLLDLDWFKPEHAQWLLTECPVVQDIFEQVCRSGILRLRNSRNNTVAAIEALDPAINWPTISRDALVSAIAVTAVTAAVAVGGAVMFRRTQKVRATKRLALREAQFKKAQDAYNENPNSPIALKKLHKANARLNKAWVKAGRAGLASYNGFATSPSSTIVTSDAGSPIIGAAAQLMTNPSVSVNLTAWLDQYIRGVAPLGS